MQLRDARKEQAASNVQQANAYYGGGDPEADDMDMNENDNGLEKEAEAGEQEYSNDEMTSRVVIENLRLSEDEDQYEEGSEEGGHQQQQDAFEKTAGIYSDNIFAILAPAHVKASRLPSSTTPGRITTNNNKANNKSIEDILSIGRTSSSLNIPKPNFASSIDSPTKIPPKRFTYETKAARRAESLKQKSKRLEKVEYSKSRKVKGTKAKMGRGTKKVSSSSSSRKKSGKK